MKPHELLQGTKLSSLNFITGNFGIGFDDKKGGRMFLETMPRLLYHKVSINFESIIFLSLVIIIPFTKEAVATIILS